MLFLRKIFKSRVSACNVEDRSLIPGLGRSPGEGTGNPLQYSCLENSMDRVSYSPWDRKELDTTEQLTVSVQFSCILYLFPFPFP